MTNKRIKNKFNIGRKVYHYDELETLNVYSFIINCIFCDNGKIYYSPCRIGEYSSFVVEENLLALSENKLKRKNDFIGKI